MEFGAHIPHSKRVYTVLYVMYSKATAVEYIVQTTAEHLAK